MIDDRSSSPNIRKTISEPQTGIELETFRWLVRRSNHWDTNTQMASSGGSSTYVLPKREPGYVNNVIRKTCILPNQLDEATNCARQICVKIRYQQIILRNKVKNKFRKTMTSWKPKIWVKTRRRMIAMIFRFYSKVIVKSKCNYKQAMWFL